MLVYQLSEICLMNAKKNTTRNLKILNSAEFFLFTSASNERYDVSAFSVKNI